MPAKGCCFGGETKSVFVVGERFERDRGARWIGTYDFTTRTLWTLIKLPSTPPPFKPRNWGSLCRHWKSWLQSVYRQTSYWMQKNHASSSILCVYIYIYFFFCEKEQAAITVGVFLVGSRWLDSIFWFTNMQGFMPSDLSSTMQGVQRSEMKWNEVNRVAQEAALRTLKLRLRHGFSFFHRLLLATLATYMSRFPLPYYLHRIWVRRPTREVASDFGRDLERLSSRAREVQRFKSISWYGDLMWFVFYENYLAIKTIFHIFHMYRWYFGHLICI